MPPTPEEIIEWFVESLLADIEANLLADSEEEVYGSAIDGAAQLPLPAPWPHLQGGTA